MAIDRDRLIDRYIIYLKGMNCNIHRRRPPLIKLTFVLRPYYEIELIVAHIYVVDLAI